MHPSCYDGRWSRVKTEVLHRYYRNVAFHLLDPIVPPIVLPSPLSHRLNPGPCHTQEACQLQIDTNYDRVGHAAF